MVPENRIPEMDGQPKVPSLKRLMIRGAWSYVAVMGVAVWADLGFWWPLFVWFSINLGLFWVPYAIHKGVMR